MSSASRNTSPLGRSARGLNAPAAIASPTGSLPVPHGSEVQTAFRSPRRVTITLAWSTYEALQVRADAEGRSLSNLAAFLLESGIKGPAAAAVASVAATPLRRAPENPFH
jgi:hypothetical protein